MPPASKKSDPLKSSPAKPTGGARPKSAGAKRKRKKKAKKKPVADEARDDALDDDCEGDEGEDEIDIVYACPACGLGAGTSVPMGCPYSEPCRGMMFVCRREDGGGRCGRLCWHSHPNEFGDDDVLTYSTAYWCRVCHDECEDRSGCAKCHGHSGGVSLQELEQSLWAQFGEPVR